MELTLVEHQGVESPSMVVHVVWIRPANMKGNTQFPQPEVRTSEHELGPPPEASDLVSTRSFLICPLAGLAQGLPE